MNNTYVYEFKKNNDVFRRGPSVPISEIGLFLPQAWPTPVLLIFLPFSLTFFSLPRGSRRKISLSTSLSKNVDIKIQKLNKVE